jgi:hypothetical protein
MGLFRSRKSGASALSAQLENELDSLRSRRKSIQERLATAQQRLGDELAARRARILQHDMDSGNVENARDQVIHLRDATEAAQDALDTVTTRIVEAEQTLAAERDRLAREAEVAKRRAEIAEAREELAAYLAQGERLVSKLQTLAPICVAVGAAGGSVQHCSRELNIGIEAGLVEAEGYVARLLEGVETIKVEPPPAETPKPAPKIARQPVFLRVAGKWMENGETRTSGPHTAPDLPVEVAELAIAHGHALPMDPPVAAELRRQQDPDYAFWPANRCVDLIKPRPLPQAQKTTIVQAPTHSEFIPHGARVGVATATPLR